MYTLTDGIIDAFCSMLKPYVHKKIRPQGARKDGIVVMYNKTDIGLIMFRFIHKEELEIQLPLELNRLPSEGRDYLLGRIEMLEVMTEKALEEKQKDNRIVIHNLTPPAKNMLAKTLMVDDGSRQRPVVHK